MSHATALRLVVALALLASVGLATPAVSTCIDDDCAPLCGDCALCAPSVTLAGWEVILPAPFVSPGGSDDASSPSTAPPRQVEHVPLVAA